LGLNNIKGVNQEWLRVQTILKELVKSAYMPEGHLCYTCEH